MTNRLFARFAFAAVFFLSAGVATAQHDMGGGGTTSGSATGGGATSSSPSRATTTVKRPPRRTPPPRTTTPPPKRGITAEQYNAQGDEYFKAENYDDALEAYQRA